MKRIIAFFRNPRPSHSERWWEGYNNANLDIANHGLKYSETVMLSLVQFKFEPFTDGYTARVQKEYTKTNS